VRNAHEKKREMTDELAAYKKWCALSMLIIKKMILKKDLHLNNHWHQ